MFQAIRFQDIKAQEDSEAAERLWFVEEQNVRRSLGTALWQTLCGELEKECGNMNSVTGERMIYDRKPLTFALTDTKSGKSLLLSYQEIGPCINCRESGKSETNITFRVDKTPAPSLTLMYCGIPKIPQDLALSLIIGLTR